MLSRIFKFLRFIRRKIIRIERHEVFVADTPVAKGHTWLPGEDASIVSGGEELSSEMREALLYYSPANQEFIDALGRCEVDGLFVRANEKLVHYAFLMRHNKTTRLMGFDRDTALIGNMYTAFDYRGKGCQGRATAGLLEWASCSGVQRVIAETSYANKISQHGLINGGMRPFGRVELLIILNFFVIRYKRPIDNVSMLEIVF